MTEPMHNLLAAAIDRTTHAFAEGRAFADAHERRVVRAIRTRRVATYASVGSAAVAFALGAGLGVTALAGTSLNLFPAGEGSPAPSMSVPSITPSAQSLATPVVTTLVPVEIDASAYPAGETSRSYLFLVSLGTMEMIPFPASGIWYPGISDVPSDAMIVAVSGDLAGYDLTAPDAPLAGIQAWPAWTDQYDMVGNRDAEAAEREAAGQNASINWDVIGDVTDHTRWGVHYFILDGNVVTEAEGRANPDAIEVTAWHDPAAAVAEPVAVPVTAVATTLVQVPLDDSIWPDGDPHRIYVFYASRGATDMVPSPYSGYWYEGIPDVPSDAVIVGVDGDLGGFDFTDPGSYRTIGAEPAWESTGTWAGGLRGAGSGFDWEGYGDIATWEVIGEVTDHTSWGIHYFLLDDDVVTLVDGRANPDAVEVNAWFDPATFTAIE